jgi:hypothetical protein
VLSFCRAALALRRAEQRGEIADYELLRCADGQWQYRVGRLVVAANFSDAPAAMPADAGTVLLRSAGPEHAGAQDHAGDEILGPWEGVVFK